MQIPNTETMQLTSLVKFCPLWGIASTGLTLVQKVLTGRGLETVQSDSPDLENILFHLIQKLALVCDERHVL